MKKVLPILLTLVLAFTAMTTVVSAATASPEKPFGIITGVECADYVLDVVAPQGDIADFGTAPEGYTFADHKELILKARATVTGPLNVIFTANGVTAATEGYILAEQEDGTLVKVEATFSEGKIAAAMPGLGEFVLVLKTSDTDVPPSDQTGDTATPVAFAVLMVGAALAAVSVKKLKA